MQWHHFFECRIDSEREAASRELLTRRSQRLRELYTSEHEQYKLELLSLGLCIADNTLKGAPYCWKMRGSVFFWSSYLRNKSLLSCNCTNFSMQNKEWSHNLQMGFFSIQSTVLHNAIDHSEKMHPMCCEGLTQVSWATLSAVLHRFPGSVRVAWPASWFVNTCGSNKDGAISPFIIIIGLVQNRHQGFVQVSKLGHGSI